MENWKLYTDEEYRENKLKGGFRMSNVGIWDLRTPAPSAQDIIDAIELEVIAIRIR
jgi:hypothetical protein